MTHSNRFTCSTLASLLRKVGVFIRRLPSLLYLPTRVPAGGTTSDRLASPERRNHADVHMLAARACEGESSIECRYPPLLAHATTALPAPPSGSRECRTQFILSGGKEERGQHNQRGMNPPHQGQTCTMGLKVPTAQGARGHEKQIKEKGEGRGENKKPHKHLHPRTNKKSHMDKKEGATNKKHK